jgi:hypothetical protein
LDIRELQIVVAIGLFIRYESNWQGCNSNRLSNSKVPFFIFLIPNLFIGSILQSYIETAVEMTT